MRRSPNESILAPHEAGPDNLGLACTDDGLLLGQTPLIERRGGRFVVRERTEIEWLLKRAYPTELALDRLMPGLATVASAMNANDPCLARIAAVHLKIPDLPHQTARDAMEAADILIKYARDEGGGSDWNPALHPRTGTPPNSGWFAPTGRAGSESSPIRTAENDDPTQRSDASASGSRPGDPFPTANAAAVAALLAVYAIARSANLEYSGRIYQNADGSFSYTRGLTDSQRDPSIPNRNCCFRSSTPGRVPAGTVDMGSYHTHTDGGASDEFSVQDVAFYTYTDKLPGYVAGTNAQGIGIILQFTPGETVSQGVTQLMGTISSGRFVLNPAYDPNKKPSRMPPGGDSYDPDREGVPK
jgi:hypothetical protein